MHKCICMFKIINCTYSSVCFGQYSQSSTAWGFHQQGILVPSNSLRKLYFLNSINTTAINTWALIQSSTMKTCGLVRTFILCQHLPNFLKRQGLVFLWLCVCHSVSLFGVWTLPTWVYILWECMCLSVRPCTCVSVCVPPWRTVLSLC